MRISKEMTIDCAHYLPGHKGKCKNLHGHTYRIRLSIQGQLNDEGMIIDFGELKKIMEEVIGKYDHKFLNDYMANPTVENMAFRLMGELKEWFDPNQSLKLRIYETPDSFAEVFGNEL